MTIMKIKLFGFVIIYIVSLPLFAQTSNESMRWQRIFEKYNINGTIVVCNISSDECKVYNKHRSDSAYLPASTFKILNSMIALQTGSIKNVNDTIKWNGEDRGWSEWNKDQTMKTAMPLSCIWFYQELARRIGKEDMQKWIDTVGYGNSQMGGLIDNFWLEGDLRISAKEQIIFLKKLIKNKLAFNTSIQESVKEIMITDSTDNYMMHSKTGWAMRISTQIGWFVGFVETKQGTWIFALNQDIINKSDAKYRKLITYEILKAEGIIK